MKHKQTERSSDRIIKDIKRKTRRHYNAEEKISIVLEGLRGEDSIAELCRREGISQGIYYKWSKDFMEAGKKRLAGDIVLTTQAFQNNADLLLSIVMTASFTFNVFNNTIR